MKDQNNKELGKTEDFGDSNAAKTIPKSAWGKKKIKDIGSARGIETMFRCAFRTQMDMLSLAAVKANIMITINGLIASALVVSGAFIYASEPLFLPPASVFLATSAISIYFAIQAASPNSRQFEGKFKDKPSLQNFKEGKANILIFEDYAHLSKDEYMECMGALLQNNEQIYTKMIDHLYWLGTTAERKFKMLRYAYSVFRVGIILAIVMLLIMQLFVYVSKQAEAANGSLRNNHDMSKFERIYEPSGIQQLADGQYVVVEDDRGMKIITLQSDGSIVEKSLLDSSLNSITSPIQDLEGVAADAQGYIYAVTSHSRTDKKGVRKPAREQLIRFRIEGEKIVDKSAFTGLRTYFEQADIFAEVGGQQADDINIEAISFDKEKKWLLIGFRFPLIDDKALIVVLKNPNGIFERHEEPRFSDQTILLDLHGEGIRSLTYDHYLGGYLLTNEFRDKKKGKKRSKLWFWSGNAIDNPRPITVPGLKNLKNAEGVSVAMVADEAGIIIVGDNGNAKKGKPARYLLRSYNQISSH